MAGGSLANGCAVEGEKVRVKWPEERLSGKGHLIATLILELEYDSDCSASVRIHMFAIAFSAMVILALVSIVVHWTMRIRLMRLDSTKDRIEWLSFHRGDDVLNTYEALFPRSVLPRFCRLVFWAAIVIAAVGLCAVVVLKVSGR